MMKIVYWLLGGLIAIASFLTGFLIRRVHSRMGGSKPSA